MDLSAFMSEDKRLIQIYIEFLEMCRNPAEVFHFQLFDDSSTRKADLMNV